MRDVAEVERTMLMRMSSGSGTALASWQIRREISEKCSFIMSFIDISSGKSSNMLRTFLMEIESWDVNFLKEKQCCCL